MRAVPCDACRHISLILFLASALSVNASHNSVSGASASVFKIPELVVYANSSYLNRNVETRLECRIAGQPVEWASATLEHVMWLRDGTPIDASIATTTSSRGTNSGESANFVVEGPALRIVRSGYHSEGEYQCTAIVRQINLSPARLIDTRLVSAPLKLRRARITKFEPYEPPVVRVQQGQVARLPCYGLPDVIPGPPELWFEKVGHEGLALGKTGNERFIVTVSGLQIALSQPTDAGRYFCIVRNTFTNQTRKAPHPVYLVVDSHDFSSDAHTPAPLVPRVIFPDISNHSESIDIHVVVGESVVLECVIWDAKVVWNKTDHSLATVSLTDDRARIRQIWGNLRIKQIRLDDAGEYVCRGIPLFELASTHESQHKSRHHPSAIYRLIVHAPTNVRLMLAQSLNDKSWQLSCYAHNLHYEIPMVYVNGLALIDAMDEMGVPPHTNFFTNPINVTLGSANPLAGSVQCISRPAMEEAEIYGTGLERGRAMNLFVDERMNVLASPLPPHAAHSDISPRAAGTRTAEGVEVRSRHSERIGDDNNDVVQIQRPLAFVAGDNSVRIQWRVEQRDDSKRFRIQHFLVEILRRDSAKTVATVQSARGIDYSAEEEEDYDDDDATNAEVIGDGKWQLLERVPPHVRALTLRRVVVVASREFQLRVTAVLESSRRISSEPTDWLKISKIQGQKHNNVSTTPQQPIITRLQPTSPHSIFVAWNNTESALSSPLKYVITFQSFEINYQKMRQKSLDLHGDMFNNDKTIASDSITENKDERSKESWNGWMQRTIEISAQRARNELLLTDLIADTEYKVTVIAINAAGRSLPSTPRITRTYELLDDTLRGESWITKLRRDYLNLPDVNIKFELMLVAFCIAALLLTLLCYLTVSRLREWRLHAPLARHRSGPQQGSSIGSANQFFFDSSSPGLSARSPTTSEPYVLRQRKADRCVFEPPLLGAKNHGAGEISPLGIYDNVYRRDEKDFSLQLSLQNNNFVKSSLMKNALNDNNNNNDDVDHVSRRMLKNKSNEKEMDSFQLQKPNLYGNPNATLDELLEDIYGTTQPRVNATLSRNATINRAETLRRSQRRPYAPLMSPTSAGQHYANSIARPSSELRYGSSMTPNDRKSPSPSTMSTSMYGYASSVLIQPIDAIKTSYHVDAESTQRCLPYDYMRPENHTTISNHSDAGSDLFGLQTAIKKSMADDTSSVGFPNGMPTLNRLPYFDSVYSSRLSLSNCGNSSVAYGDIIGNSSHTKTSTFRGDDSGHFGVEDATSTPTADAQPSILSVLPISSRANCGGNLLSTFKASPAPSSCSGSSSGYNSSYGGNNGAVFPHVDSKRPAQSPLTIAKFHGENSSIINSGSRGLQNGFASSNYSTIERRKRNPTIAIAPTFFSRIENNDNNNNIDFALRPGLDAASPISDEKNTKSATS